MVQSSAEIAEIIEKLSSLLEFKGRQAHKGLNLQMTLNINKYQGFSGSQV